MLAKNKAHLIFEVQINSIYLVVRQTIPPKYRVGSMFVGN